MGNVVRCGVVQLCACLKQVGVWGPLHLVRQPQLPYAPALALPLLPPPSTSHAPLPLLPPPPFHLFRLPCTLPPHPTPPPTSTSLGCPVPQPVPILLPPPRVPPPGHGPCTWNTTRPS